MSLFEIRQLERNKLSQSSHQEACQRSKVNIQKMVKDVELIP
jgi:hypothetical protein